MEKKFNNLTRDWVQKAYKKLKNNLYFDKTQLPLVDDLVAFESSGIEGNISEIVRALKGKRDVWEDFTADILEKIDVYAFPKRLCSGPEGQIVFNADSEPIEMESAKYFIDLPIAGHILGTLWVMIIGACLDDRDDPDRALMYEHSYGNRLRKNLYNPDSGMVTYSPYLFEPYFSQYESWRDTALAHAKERLNGNQDALILTLDFRNFFYSVHISEEDFDGIFETFLGSVNGAPPWSERIHGFVYQVLQAYSDKVRQINRDEELPLGDRTFLPIGFLPSYILSNWALTFFDKAISERINPVYYGRYVDDIIIVDKVEKNSPLHKKARGTWAEQTKLTAGDVIEHYFAPCSGQEDGRAERSDRIFCAVNEVEMTPKQRESLRRQEADPNLPPFRVYRIDPSVFRPRSGGDDRSDIQIQNDKVKIFYFREGSTRALLDCFRAEIGRNASEFRYLPDVDRTLGDNDYSEIFKLSNRDTPHKLRGVSSVSLDKFSLSKFLGKYRKVGNLIRDKRENAFDRDLLTILDRRALIENYTLWERLLEILVINDRLDYYEKLVKNIMGAIAAYEVPDQPDQESTHRRGLYLTLRAAVCRTSALCWGKKMNQVLAAIQEAEDRDRTIDVPLFREYDLKERRAAYCQCRMVNKYVLPLPVGWLKEDVFEEEVKTINLCRLENFSSYVDWSMTGEPYLYFPYMVTPHEIAYGLTCKNIAEGEQLDDPSQQIARINELYNLWNYDISIDDGPVSAEAKTIQRGIAAGCCAVRVDTPASGEIKVAIGNAKLYESDFKKALIGKPNRSHERYRQVAKLLKEALAAQADLLVLPENYLPWEWLPDITRLCANNQMALVTGIEHIVSGPLADGARKVYNLTAVILPYRENDYRFAHIICHHKVHYSPNEARMIRGYRMNPFEGTQYQLFCWRDLWFSVYCCYELASITDRSLFQALADLTVAVEWNRDIPYFGSIVESLCRDLHCYCIQVNSSDFGDSRVMVPAKSEERDLIKTKGGRNHTILMDHIELDPLRDYQRKEYELQRDDRRFKPTPPRFERSIPEHKQNGTLWEYLTGD